MQKLSSIQSASAQKEVVLLGGGHSHVVALQRLARHPIPGVRLTLICATELTPYSGMLPGYIAGHYAYEDMHINLRHLADYAGARLIIDQANGIDGQQRRVLCRSGAQIPYDLLSVNIGSTPQMSAVEGAAAHAVPVKPIADFNQRWLSLLARIKQHSGPMRIAVVGGGAGGVELLLAMQYRLEKELANSASDVTELAFILLTRDQHILPTHNTRVRAKFLRVLEDRGVTVCPLAEVTAVEPGRLCINGQHYQDADEVLWVTHAGGASWLRNTHLKLDDQGFIQVGDSLQSLNDERIFAAGDIATQINHPREKTGVIAVRQGPPLAENLRAAAAGERLRRYRPQRHWLALITTGGRYAVASRGLLSWAGTWLWYWKNWIDRRFMARFTKLAPRKPVNT